MSGLSAVVFPKPIKLSHGPPSVKAASGVNSLCLLTHARVPEHRLCAPRRPLVSSPPGHGASGPFPPHLTTPSLTRGKLRASSVSFLSRKGELLWMYAAFTVMSTTAFSPAAPR